MPWYPTVGGALSALGYDRDPGDVGDSDEPAPGFVKVPGWREIRQSLDRGSVEVPTNVVIDLGATGKALAADRAAKLGAQAGDCGVLVNLGGDIAVAGPTPEGGWPVGVSDSHRTARDHVVQTVAIHHGAIATSSVTARAWRRSGARCHHIIDPKRGTPADVVWRTVSVAAASCVAAGTRPVRPPSSRELGRLRGYARGGCRPGSSRPMVQ